MLTVGVAVAFGVRLMLVLLFLPFSALDKIFDFRGAVHQATEVTRSPVLARGLVLGGLGVEVLMSAAVLCGVADRAAALVLAVYCMVTALLWKQFWRPGDFWAASDSRGRTLFWDFWKNLAVAGGFLLLTFGTDAGGVERFLSAPLSSTHPYALPHGNVP